MTALMVAIGSIATITTGLAVGWRRQRITTAKEIEA